MRPPRYQELDEHYFYSLFFGGAPEGASIGLAEDLARSVLYVQRARDAQLLLAEKLAVFAADPDRASSVSGPERNPISKGQLDDVLTGLEQLAGYEVKGIGRRNRLIRQWCVMVELCSRRP
ncbi:hypothetical protein [Rhodoplanes sp. SY1]|uniref:hypothetical protein n=1 Tax=Rhodoplanes sp. SY1 TaxID=3166646 RepID=UPI0038B699A1